MDVHVDVILRGLPRPSWLRNHPAGWEGGRAGAFQFTVCLGSNWGPKLGQFVCFSGSQCYKGNRINGT